MEICRYFRKTCWLYLQSRPWLISKIGWFLPQYVSFRHRGQLQGVRAVMILACQHRKKSTDPRSRGWACLAWCGIGGRTTGQSVLLTVWTFRAFRVACSRRGQCANTVSMDSINSSFFTKPRTCAYITLAADIISWCVDSAWLYSFLPNDLIYLLVAVPGIKLLTLC